MAANNHIASIDEINLVEREIEDRLALRDETVTLAARMLTEATSRARAGQDADFIIDVAPSAPR